MNVAGQPSLLMDGLITHSFGPHAAEYILRALLKTSPNVVAYMHPAAHDYPPSFSVYLYYFASLGVPANASTADNHQLLLIDLLANLTTGSVVPQRLWRPLTQADQLQHVENAHLCMPIFFVDQSGAVGVPLTDAALGRCRSLKGAELAPDMNMRYSTQIRIGWSGYMDWYRQIQIRDETTERKPIKLRRLVQHIGRSVDYFIRDGVPDTRHPSPEWRIGAPGGITREEIRILGIINVSSGSWMPLLQVTKFVF